MLSLQLIVITLYMLCYVNSDINLSKKVILELDLCSVCVGAVLTIVWKEESREQQSERHVHLAQKLSSMSSAIYSNAFLKLV